MRRRTALIGRASGTTGEEPTHRLAESRVCRLVTEGGVVDVRSDHARPLTKAEVSARGRHMSSMFTKLADKLIVILRTALGRGATVVLWPPPARSSSHISRNPPHPTVPAKR